MAEALVSVILSMLRDKLVKEYRLRQVYQDKSIKEYQSLYQSIKEGKWKSVKEFLVKNKAAVTGSITEGSNTALMVAVMTRQSEDFLNKLLGLISETDGLATLVKTNKLGNTALHEAAIVGHVDAAKLLVQRETSLLRTINNEGHLPLHSAATYGQKEIIYYFLSKNVDKEQKSWTQESLAKFLHLSINARLFDVALHVLDRNPDLAHLLPTKDGYPVETTDGGSSAIPGRGTHESRISGGLDTSSASEIVVEEPSIFPSKTHESRISGGLDISSPLETIAEDPSAFPSGTHFNIWQSFIYFWFKAIEVQKEGRENAEGKHKDAGEEMEQGFKAIEVQREGRENVEGKQKDAGEETDKGRSTLFTAAVRGIPMKWKRLWRGASDGRDEENQADSSRYSSHYSLVALLIFALGKLCAICYRKVLEITVSSFKHVKDIKVMHRHGHDLIKRLCKQVTDSHNSSALSSLHSDASKKTKNSELSSILRKSFLLAAQHGIKEIVEEILASRPDAIDDFLDEEGHSALHLAVMYRHNNVFNTFVQRSVSLKRLSLSKDQKGNNILHLAGYKPQQQRLHLVSRAVLQMQRELQWYKAVEKFVPVQATKAKNHEGKTPLMVFNEEHSDMIKSEEQWIVGTATSCTVATTIIATIAFAAAITVPGGNNSDGLPMFSKERAFMIFSISNALALFSSITTLLIFLSILTSRYAVIDFLDALPRKLITGLFFLFLSVTSMIIAFSATLYLVFPHKYKPIVALACLPLAYLPLSLLLNMIKSTYASSIFIPPVSPN